MSIKEEKSWGRGVIQKIVPDVDESLDDGSSVEESSDDEKIILRCAGCNDECDHCSDNVCCDCEKVFCNQDPGCIPLYVCENETDELEICHHCAFERIDDRDSEWKMDFNQMKRFLDFEKTEKRG